MSSNPRYITYPIITDARSLMAKGFAYVQAKFSGWNPSEGQLDTALIEATASEAADIGTLASQVPKAIFRYYGAKLFGIPPIDATYATTTATVFFTDTAPHTILAGTQVAIVDPLGNEVPFRVLLDVAVAGGVGSGVVSLIAIVAGADSSGIGTPGDAVNLLDVYSWINNITLIATTAGGQDAESDDDYLSRLSSELITVTPTPILPADFALLAKNVPGVQRATAIDGYNTSGGTYGNERMVTMVALDNTGAGVSSGVKTALAAYLTSLREINFVVNTLDPTVNQTDVQTQVVALAGYDATDLQTRITSAITNYLNPAIWGIDPADDPNDPITWNLDNVIRYLELATIVANVSGVLRIQALVLGAHGGALSSADYNMTGVAPIPHLITCTVTVL